MIPPGVHLPAEGTLPGFSGATAWLNSEPLTPEGLRGKVVVADFCTYTCINWLRSLPYVRAWDERYRSDGLVTIGIHTPEFSFERNLDNVRRALEQMRVTYPVVVDNDYGVWNAFANHYWPALYFVDAAGTHPAPPIRRRRLRAIGGRDPTAARGRRCRHLRGRSGLRGSERSGGGGRLGSPQHRRDLPRVSAGRELRVTRWDGARRHRRTTRRHSASVTTTGRSPVSGP